MKPMRPTLREQWLLLAAYAPLHFLLLLPANVVWHPPAGLRFAWLVLLPMRWWLPLAIWLELFYQLRGGTDWRGLLPFLASFVATSSGPWLFRLRGGGRLDSVDALRWLLAAMVLASAANALQIVAWPPGWAAGIPARELFLQLVMGDYIGMLVTVPLALLVLQQRPRREHWSKWRVDLPLVLLPLLALLAWTLPGPPGGRTYLLAACIALPPAIYMAFRTGWRGVTVLLSASSLLIALAAWEQQELPVVLESQAAMALAGSVLLLLGAATESLRMHQRELHRSNEELHAQAAELRAAARRNLQLSENVRRWVTSELHDQLGQDLTALQARLTLAERRTGAGDLMAPAWDIIRSMRRTISSLMTTLRPASLDEFGLRQALEHGPIRKLVELGGLAFEVQVDDPAGRLAGIDDQLETALYRIAQEAATNTVRHAHARAFGIRLRCRPQGRITLLVHDDGKGAAFSPGSGGLGLQGIRDRVMSLGGRMRLRSDARGTRLLVAFDP